MPKKDSLWVREFVCCEVRELSSHSGNEIVALRAKLGAEEEKVSCCLSDVAAGTVWSQQISVHLKKKLVEREAIEEASHNDPSLRARKRTEQ